MRGRGRWGLGGVAVLLAAAALVWFGLLPEYRPELRAGERYGIDVSHHQGRVDWDRVAGDGVSLAYLKATEGDDFVDRRFAANWSGAASAGINRGAYHFFTLCSSGAAQAANFLRTVPVDPEALPPAVDLEFSACTARPDPADVQRELGIFVATVEARVGRPVVLYALPVFTRAYPLPASLTRDRWVRSLLRRPSDPDWSIWQVSNVARVDGIGARVDLDVWRAGDVTG